MRSRRSAALEGISYIPAANYNGADSPMLVADDLGNSGTGGAITDVDFVAITVSAVNDNPVNSVPGAQVTVEETALAFSPTNGTLTFDTLAGLTVLRARTGRPRSRCAGCGRTSPARSTRV